MEERREDIFLFTNGRVPLALLTATWFEERKMFKMSEIVWSSSRFDCARENVRTN